MYRNGRLPESIKAERLPTGTIRIYPAAEPAATYFDQSVQRKVVVYARIHPRLPRTRLEEQVVSCKAFCHARGWIISEVVREIGSGVESDRSKLKKLMADPPARIVVLAPSVISRFDFALIEQCFKSKDCALTVIDESEEIEGSGGALEDLVDAISTTCRCHYGQKRGALLIDALLKLIKEKSI